ncbi:MAG: hypothetical protein ACK2UR_12510 [Candidatus Promineifilaceae bacterium]|jgi:hypothetical protein
MPIFCASSYPGFAIAVVITLCLILVLDQQLHILSSQRPGFGRHSERLLLAMLVAALLEIGLFVVYVVGARTGC